MSLGSPVISTAVGAEGIDAVADKQIVIANSPKEFADAIHFLWHNPVKGEEIRKAARKLVEENYNWELIGHKLRQYLQSFKR